MKWFSQVWRTRSYKTRFQFINNKDFIGIYGHVGFGWHVLIGWDKPCQ